MRKITIELLGSDVVAIEKFRKEMVEYEKGKAGDDPVVKWNALTFEQLVEVFITVKAGEMERG